MACLAVHWDGTPGPKTKRTLEGVGYHLRMSPGMEPPFSISELWLFVRIFRFGEGRFKKRFRAKFGRRTPRGLVDMWQHPLGIVETQIPNAILDRAWPIRPCIFPLSGAYEVRLQSLQRTEIGLRWTTTKVEYFSVEEER
jgi:hypothetical protein